MIAIPATAATAPATGPTLLLSAGAIVVSGGDVLSGDVTAIMGKYSSPSTLKRY